MKRIRDIVTAVVCLLVLGATAPMSAQDARSFRGPNIVFILADDLGLRDLGCTGSDYHQTPRLDALAAQGMMFTDAYANCANCAPTRAALMSGQYAPRTGVYTVANSDRGPDAERKLIPIENTKTLSADIVTLAESLQAVGYTTGHFGKWHLGDGDTGPLGQGFDTNVAGNHHGHPRSYHSPYQNPDLEDGPNGEYLTDRLTDEAIGFMQENKDEPFFLYLPYYTVHTPLQPREDLLATAQDRAPGERHRNARYAAMIDGMDRNVGRLLAELEALGLDDNTLVVFMSDNGGMSPQTDMAPLRGSKGMPYEGGVRVPLIVRWPGVVEPGSRCAEPVITLDFYPTLLEVAGGEMPADQPADGASLLPLFQDGDAALQREALYWHFPCYLHGYRGMQEEGPREGWRAIPNSVVRAGEWKLIRDYESGTDTLYNLRRDIGETTDLADRAPEKRAELAALLDAWLADLDAPIPTEPNPAYAGE